MKYIDAEQLIAEIEKILAKAEKDEKKALLQKDAASHLIAVTKTAICVRIKKSIASLQQEQPKVDLEKEVHRFFEECIEVHEVPLYGKVKERVISVDCYEMTAYHFYKLGLNTRKEE